MLMIAIVVILAAIAIYWIAGRSAKAPEIPSVSNNTTNTPTAPANAATNTTTPSPNTKPPVADSPLTGDNNSLSIASQAAGKSVVVDALSLIKPGFVTIHEIDAQGKPGKIIGTSKLITAGAKTDLIVAANTVAGKTYIAMLHIDDGNGKFDITKDKEATDANGRPVEIKFVVK